jgi:hypothetical protein
MASEVKHLREGVDARAQDLSECILMAARTAADAHRKLVDRFRHELRDQDSKYGMRTLKM